MNLSCPKCSMPFDSTGMSGLCPRCVALDFLTPTGFEAGNASGDGVEQYQESGKSFAGFDLIEEMGRGGMGVVFRALQRNLGREVALKFLLHGILAGDAALARFREEAETAAGLRHPNIVRILEIGEAQGRHYIAMELIHGRPLSELTREGPLTASRAARYLQRTSMAVHYAHEHGVLHRDLKPANVLIDEQDEPRITDFGLAKRLNDRRPTPSEAALTLTGQVLGTPAYISPEQAGSGGRVDARSDVYSLGALLYHLVAGRPPFVGESPTHVLRQVADTEPVAPGLFNPSLPRDLEIICLKCLEKDPSRRYATARELAEDLSRFSNDEPIHARPVSPAERAWRWCKRKPALASSLAGIALLLASIAVGSSIATRRLETMRLDALTNLYASDMRLAQQAIAENKFGFASELLERHQPKGRDPDLRGFEWRHFRARCDSDEWVTLGSHSNQAQRALFSPDGRLIATASTHVRIWDARSHQQRFVLSCGDFVRALAFSPDSQRLVVAEHAGGLRAFDLATGLEIAQWIHSGPTPFAVRWTTNDSRVELWAEGRRAIWDWKTNVWIDPVGLPENSSRDSVSHNGIFASLQRAPWRLDVWSDNELLANLHAVGPSLSSAVSADGHEFALGEFSGLLNFFTLHPKPSTNRIQAHRGLINALAFSAQGDRLASGGMDQVIRIWNTASGQLINELRGHRRPIWSLAFSPDGDWMVSGDASGVVKLWPTRIQLHDTRVAGSGHALISSDGAASAFAETNGVRWVRAGHPSEIRLSPPEFQAGSGQLAGVTPSHVLWVAKSGEPILVGTQGIEAAAKLPQAIVPVGVWLSPSGRFLLHQTPGSKSISARDLVTGESVWELDPGPKLTRVLALSANNQWVVTGDTAGILRILELATGREHRSIHAHVSAAYAADFSPDGRHLVSAGHDGVVKWWETNRGLLLGTFHSFTDAYWTVAFAPDGTRIAAGTSESTIVLWDTASRHEVATFQLGGSLEPVEGVLRFSPEGSSLLFCAHGTLRQWVAPLPKRP